MQKREFFYWLTISNFLYIVILLILAGVGINLVLGPNGLITKAQEAALKTEEANAEEQVQLAVTGSIGTDGNIDNRNLRDNLSKIQGIEGIPTEITDDSYPLIVTIDGYKVKISRDGTVKQPGKWAEATNSDGETIITDGTIELKIGDYVNYDEQTGDTTTSYTSTPDKSGYTSDQMFNLSSYQYGWRVLGIDEDTDEILLVSEDFIGPDSGVYTHSTYGRNYYYLRGQTGYVNGEEELDTISELYGQGKGASGARSITVDDVNKLTEYNPDTEGYGSGNIYAYGNEVTYTKNSETGKIEYSGSNGVNGTSNYTSFTYYDEVSGEWKTLERPTIKSQALFEKN